jgi:hypothetical protein
MATLDTATFNTHGRDDEVALMQIGAALILAWPDLDADLQRDMLTTAEHITGIRADPKMRETVDRLVRTNASGQK